MKMIFSMLVAPELLKYAVLLYFNKTKSKICARATSTKPMECLTIHVRDFIIAIIHSMQTTKP